METSDACKIYTDPKARSLLLLILRFALRRLYGSAVEKIDIMEFGGRDTNIRKYLELMFRGEFQYTNQNILLIS